MNRNPLVLLGGCLGLLLTAEAPGTTNVLTFQAVASPATPAAPVSASCAGNSCTAPSCCDSCSSCCGLDWYVGVRAGTIFQNRRPFRYGRVADDANDFETPDLFTRPSYELKDWGPTFELYAGRQLNECTAVEARFAYASFEQTSRFRFVDPADEGQRPSFWIPFLDANADAHEQGIAGLRFRRANTALDYESEWYDFGFDLVRTISSNNGGQISVVFGPAFANIDQDFRHSAIGSFGREDDPQPREARTREQINEWFYGAKVGARANRCVGPRLTIDGGLFLFLYYQDAELEARQSLVGPDDTSGTFRVTDSASRFVPRIQFRLAARYAWSECVTVGAFYDFGAWFDVANVVNPDLAIQEIDGDNRWVGNRAAHLGREDLITHTIGASVEFRR